jgi:hypothetical protein
MTVEFKKTLSDIDVILNEMDDELTNKVPEEFRRVIHNQKLDGYTPQIRTDIPIEEQQLSQETKSFLAMLYLKYWCENEDERRAFKDVLNQNEALYQKELAEKYSYDKLFNKEDTNQKEVAEETEEKKIETPEEPVQMIEYKESFFTKIINKIKSLFRR